MAAAILPNAKTQFSDKNGVPLVDGTVAFYIPGTSTPKDTWQDTGQSILNDNPLTLDERGQALIWGSGYYRQVVTDADGVEIWDEVTLAPQIGAGGQAVVFNTIADLIATPVGTDVDAVQVLGFAAAGDGGGATYTVTTGPAAVGKVQSADGQWWLLTTDRPVPEMFGALTDATATTAAMVLHASWVAASGADALYLNAKDYATNDTVTWPDCHFFGQGATITYSGTQDRAAIIMGASGVAIQSKYIFFPKVTSSALSPWTDNNYVGIALYNAKRCNIFVPEIGRFTIGFDCRGASEGWAYNNVYVGNLISNKYQLSLQVIGATGFVNENSFYGGRYGNVSTDNITLSSYGVRMWLGTGGVNICDNNRFFGPAFELITTVAIVSRQPFLITNGRNNYVYSARHESGHGSFADISGANCVLNVFDVGFKSGTDITEGVTESGGAKQNRYMSFTWTQNQIEAWNSGDLTQLVSAYSSTLNGVNPGQPVFVATSSGGTPALTISNTNLRTGSNSIRLGGASAVAVGIMLDVTTIKRWSIRASVMGGSAGPYCWIGAFDASGTRLDNSGGTDYVVGAPAGGSLSYTASYGKCWYSGVSISYLDFQFLDAVKTAIIYLSGTSAVVMLREFALIAHDAPQTTPIVVYTPNRGAPQKRSNVIPSDGNAGAYQSGDFILNATPASAEAMGWHCTATGLLAAAWTITTAYKVDEVVTNDTGKVYTCVTAGTSAGSGGPTGTGAAITDGSCVWNYVGALATFTVGAAIP